MYLGIDLGTSGLKAVIIDGDQNIIASHTSPLKVQRPHDGWSEQSPDSWIAALEESIASLQLSAAKEVSAIKGIGLSGQMHGATLLDKDDNILRPCILWNDTRNSNEAAKLDADPEFREICGNIIFPGFTAPKLSWCRNNEADLFERTSRVLLPKDYLRLYLSGEYVSEMSDAAGTGWLDIAKRDWSDSLLEKTGLHRNHMPSLVEGTDISGKLRPELASNWGMNSNVVIAGGGGDNAMSAAGLGTVKEGDAFLSLGTSGVLFVGNDSYRPKPESAVHTFCHALPDTWHQMGVILSATDALNWLAKLLGTSSQALTEELSSSLSSASATTFLPYLSGERTPHNDAHIRGAFTGLSHLTNRQDMTRSILEGVSYAFKDCQSALASTGTKIQHMLAVGGGAKSSYWIELLATVLDTPIDITLDGDFGASFGAARMGMIAAENASPASVLTKPTKTKTIVPNTKFSASLEDGYQKYRALYPAIREI